MLSRCRREQPKRRNNIIYPVIAIEGNIGKGSEAVYDHGIDAVFSIMPGVTDLETAENGAANVEQSVYNLCKMLQISRKS